MIKRILLWPLLALFTGLVSYQLFGPVPIGMADNGDFPRVLGSLRLWPDSPGGRHEFFVNDYVITDQRWNSHIPSSEWVVAALAKRIGRVVLPAGTFKLQLMGLIHAAILILAVFIFLHALRYRRWWLRLGCGLFLIFIWTDLEYVQQLSTAYTDAGAVVALCLVFAIAVQCIVVAGSWPWALGFALSGCFLVSTKSQHQTALPALIGFSLLLAFRAHSKPDRIAWLAVPLLLIATAVTLNLRTPGDYRIPPAFTLVFFKLAPLSAEPKTVLAHFQMPEDEFMRYVGHYWYEEGVPQDDDAFKSRVLRLVTPATLASFYIRNPGMLWKVLLFDLHESGSDVNLRSYGHLREIDLRQGTHPFQLTVWSDMRNRLAILAPNHLIWLFALAIIVSAIRRIQAWPLVALSWLLALTSFPFASLLDAAETARHLVFFEAATDLTIFSLVVSACLMIDKHSELPMPPKENTHGIPKFVWWLLPVLILAGLYLGTSTPRVKAPSGAHVVEDVNSAIVYSGKWTHGQYSSASEGATSFSNETGATATFPFNGTEITWVYAKAFNRGIASVKIDGVLKGDVDLYSPVVVWMATTRFAGLPAGAHTLEVSVSGRKDEAAADRYVDLDAFIIK